MRSTNITRRGLIAATAAIPVAAVAAGAARAAADKLGPSMARHHRFMLGDYEITTLLAGDRTVENPHEIFGVNASEEEFAAAAAENFLPADKAQFFFTPTLVNTGSELVLFDTGLNGAGIAEAITGAGYSPDQIDTVVITHMHGDHIGGLMTDGAPTFANARYITGSAEHNHWSAAANEGFDTNVRPLNEKMAFLDDQGAVASGITAMLAPGHTPGHMGYQIESGGRRLVLIADTANHFAFSLARPDWEVSFDADKAQAAATRHAVLGMLAADRVPFIGYHMPFPALGYLEAAGEGFRYVPASYQTLTGDL